MQFLHWLIKNCACAVCACAHTHIYTHIYVCNLQVLYLCIKYYLHLLYLCIKLFADTVPIFRKKFPDTISTWLTWKKRVFYYMIALQFFKKFNKKGYVKWLYNSSQSRQPFTKHCVPYKTWRSHFMDLICQGNRFNPRACQIGSKFAFCES